MRGPDDAAVPPELWPDWTDDASFGLGAGERSIDWDNVQLIPPELVDPSRLDSEPFPDSVTRWGD